MSLSFADLAFSSDVLTVNNLKPWWETLRSYAWGMMFASALFMVYRVNPEQSVHCMVDHPSHDLPTPDEETNSLSTVIENQIIPCNSSDCDVELPDELNEEVIAFFNTLCAPETDFISRYSGMFSMLMTTWVYLACSWWLMIPRVISGFEAVRRCDGILEGLKIPPRGIRAMTKASEHSLGTGHHANDNQIAVRNACQLLWFRNLRVKHFFDEGDPPSWQEDSESWIQDHGGEGDGAIFIAKEMSTVVPQDMESCYPDQEAVLVPRYQPKKNTSNRNDDLARHRTIPQLYALRNATALISLALVILATVGVILFGRETNFYCTPTVTKFRRLICVHNIPDKTIPYVSLCTGSAVLQFILVTIGCRKTRRFRCTNTFGGAGTKFTANKSEKQSQICSDTMNENKFIALFSEHSQVLSTPTSIILDLTFEDLAKDALLRDYVIGEFVKGDTYLSDLGHFLIGEERFRDISYKAMPKLCELCFNCKKYQRFVRIHYDMWEKIKHTTNSKCGCDKYLFAPIDVDFRGCSLLYYILNQPDGYEFSFQVAEHLLYWYCKTVKRMGTHRERDYIVVTFKRMTVKKYMASKSFQLAIKDDIEGFLRTYYGAELFPEHGLARGLLHVPMA